MRINRFLAQAGLGSRRGVERLVLEGRVRVNGAVITSLSLEIETRRDLVEVDGAKVQAEAPDRLVLYHKPIGVVCSFRRQGSSPCLADVLPKERLRGRLFHVGRLDRDSTGLLLLSDDGDLANALLHPSHPVWKRYRIRLDAPISAEAVQQIRRGELVLDGRRCAPARVSPVAGATAELRLELREGRNRQIRRMMEAVGRRVRRLHREAFGPLELGSLGAGSLRNATDEERAALERAAGLDPRRRD